MFEVVSRLFDFVLMEHVAIRELLLHAVFFPFGPDQVVDVLDALQVHGQALNTVGDFAEHGLAVQAADLLEVSELRYFHAVQPDFPAQAPGAERRVFPVVFNETHVILFQVQTEGGQRAKVKVENIFRRRFQHHLILIVMLHAVRVLAIAAILGAARWLHISGTPGFRADGAQKGSSMRSAGADFHIVRLKQGAALFVPILLQGQDDLLKCEHRGGICNFPHRPECQRWMQGKLWVSPNRQV